jgi:hypothetical protein
MFCKIVNTIIKGSAQIKTTCKFFSSKFHYPPPFGPNKFKKPKSSWWQSYSSSQSEFEGKKGVFASRLERG